MMPWTEQGNREIFFESVKDLSAQLRRWATEKNINADVSNNWPEEGSIVLAKGHQKVEIEVVKPVEGGTDTDCDHVWSLKVSDTLFGGKSLLGRWPQGWRLYNPAKVGWDEVQLGPCLEHILSLAFGIKAQTAK